MSTIVPSEGIDFSTIKADIQSGNPQSIQAALEQVWDIEAWRGMSSPERGDLVQTLMAICSPDKKVNTGYWQQIAFFLMELEPDLSLDLFEWMFNHTDPEMRDRAVIMLTQGIRFNPSPARMERFLTFIRERDATIANALERQGT